jgi:hypothetical protein
MELRAKSDVLTANEVGGRWTDTEGRVLTVDAVVPGDRLGREVQGWLEWDSPEGRRLDRYSCTLLTWADVWRDRKPRTPIAGMKVGG